MLFPLEENYHLVHRFFLSSCQMTRETKAASDTHVQQCSSVSSLLVSEGISSIHSGYALNCQSGNHVSLRRIAAHGAVHTPVRSIDEEDIRCIDYDPIAAHFPIANIQKGGVPWPASSCDLPSVPNQAGTFIHRLVKKFFSITSTSQKLFDRSTGTQTHLSLMKRTRVKPTDALLKTRILSAESHSDWKMTSKSRRERRRQRRSNNYRSCAACRQYWHCFSNPPHSLPADSLECNSNSPPAMNNNRRTTEGSMTFCKEQRLNEVQRENIGSAVELIFDTLISTYTSASFDL